MDFYERIPYLLAALLPALTLHEFGHAAVAKLYGDDTAERAGRLTLNPLAHLDMFGTLAIFLIGFGWAKPVPVNPSNFKGKWGDFWVASAGPLMNLSVAFVLALIIHSGFPALFGAENIEIVMRVLQISLFLNLALCFFNLLPIGPLDGHSVLANLLPHRNRSVFLNWNARYGSMVLLGLILIEFVLPSGPLHWFVWLPTTFMTSLLLS